MSKLLLIIFVLNIISSLIQSEYEIIEDYNPYFEIFNAINIPLYKIYKYKPSCNVKLNSKTNVYIYIESNKELYLYKYSNASKIEQDYDGNFINSDKKIYLTQNNNIIKIEDLECEKIYYFIFSYLDFVEEYNSYFFEFSFMNENTDIIDISLLLLKSKHLEFIHRT